MGLKTVALAEDIRNTIKIVQNTSSLSANYDCVIEYVDRLKTKFNKTDMVKATTYRIIKHVLKTMKSYSHLLQHNDKGVICENECLRLVWSYIFEQLFPPGGDVHVITGESEYIHSTESKREQYPKSKSVLRFKIDV